MEESIKSSERAVRAGGTGYPVLFPPDTGLYWGWHLRVVYQDNFDQTGELSGE